jgi:hypothetical protein
VLGDRGDGRGQHRAPEVAVVVGAHGRQHI